MKIRRDISSIPFRLASETWQCLVDLVTGPDSTDMSQLESAAGVMGSIITDEHPASHNIRLEGVGPQLRIYCTYGTAAIEKGGQVDSLTWNPTAGDWTMHVPCDAENMAWVKAALATGSPRIKVFDIAAPDQTDEDLRAGEAKSSEMVIDWTVRG